MGVFCSYSCILASCYNKSCVPLQKQLKNDVPNISRDSAQFWRHPGMTTNPLIEIFKPHKPWQIFFLFTNGPASSSSRAQDAHTPSSPLGEATYQFSGRSEPIALTYDQHEFCIISLKEHDRKSRNTHSTFFLIPG